MRMIMIGCEFAGKTTLGERILDWMGETMGKPFMGWHDHYVMPFSEGEGPEVDEEAAQIRAMCPRLLEKYTRYMCDYHFSFSGDKDNLNINWYYGDAVYAPLYYSYGRPGEYADRRVEARGHDARVMKIAPDTVLVLVKASAEVIRQRMAKEPERDCVVKPEDVELVLRRFQEEYEQSLIRYRFELDTTSSSPEETFQEFLRQMEPFWTEIDMLRMASRKAFR